jgi:hypothetical protein
LVWTAALVLALATGAALDQTMAIVAPSPSDAGASGETETAVRAFYAAANAVISTGDTSALDRVLAPAFVDHGAPTGATPDRAALGQSLLAVHALAPTARLEVSQVFVASDRALVRVAVDVTERTAFMGVAVGGGIPLWGSFDVFRVAGGRVAERWDSPEAPVSLLSFARLPLETDTARVLGLKLERVDFAPGEQATRSTGETRVLEVEAGILMVAVDPASAAPVHLLRRGTADNPLVAVTKGTRESLTRGDLVVLPATATYGLANVGSVPATAIVSVILFMDDPHRVGPAGGPGNPPTTSLVAAALTPGGPWPTNLSVRSLLAGTPEPPPIRDAGVGVGRVVLAPAAWLPDLTPPELMLLVVESGSVDLAAGGGVVRVGHGATAESGDVTSAVLQEGDGALVSVGRTVGLHNPGTLPASVLVVSLTPNG